MLLVDKRSFRVTICVFNLFSSTKETQIHLLCKRLKEKCMGMRVSVCLHPFPSSGEMQPLGIFSIFLAREAVSRNPGSVS